MVHMYQLSDLLMIKNAWLMQKEVAGDGQVFIPQGFVYFYRHSSWCWRHLLGAYKMYNLARVERKIFVK